MKADCICEEVDCGSPCTPDGCPGHEGRVVGVSLDGFGFFDEDFVNGDDPNHPDEVTKVVERAVAILNGEPPVHCEKCERLMRLAKRLLNWYDKDPPTKDAKVWEDLRKELSHDSGEGSE